MNYRQLNVEERGVLAALRTLGLIDERPADRSKHWSGWSAKVMAC